MKKIKLLTVTMGLCVAASLFAGCNNGTGETAAASRIDGGQTQISVETSGGADNKAPEGGYKFTYKGFDVVPGAEAAPVIKAFGEPKDQFEGASCAGQGLDIIYTYDGFKIYAYEENGVELIDGVEIEDSLIDCNGLHVGDKLDDAKNVFGTPTQEDEFGLLYRSGNTAVQISCDSFGEIISIMYRRIID